MYCDIYMYKHIYPIKIRACPPLLLLLLVTLMVNPDDSEMG